MKDPLDELAERQKTLDRRYRSDRQQISTELALAQERRLRRLERALRGKKNLLVVGDAHDRPGVSKERFLWLGRMVADTRPDIVLSVGDWCDVASLCRFDRDSKLGEGQDYTEDMVSNRAALRLYDQGVGDYPHERIITLGNHENRISKYRSSREPGGAAVSLADLGFEEHGWKVVPFLQPIEIAGFFCVHYVKKHGTERPIGGVANPPRAIALAMHRPVIYGHSHQFLSWPENTMDGQRWKVIQAGCYFGYELEYAGTDNQRWDRGILQIRGAEAGDFEEIIWTSYHTIRERYGS